MIKIMFEFAKQEDSDGIGLVNDEQSVQVTLDSLSQYNPEARCS